MNKLYIYSSIAVVILLVVLSGCSPTTLPTTGIQSTETTQTTTTTTETPSSIEIELELTGNETYSLIAIYGLEASATLKEVIVSGAVESNKNAVAHVEITAEFYNSSETLIGTSEQDFILNAAWVDARMYFIIKFSNDNPSQIEKCRLIVRAYE